MQHHRIPSLVGKSLSIVPACLPDVDYLLETVDRDPIEVADEAEYIEYLGNAVTPALLTDNKELLIERLEKEFPLESIDETASLEPLKALLYELTERRKADALQTQVCEIKDYKLYDEIQNTFAQIQRNELYDAPLLLEWNTWRAMAMLDGGEVKANLKFDDFGKPLSTAQGNTADIVCDYGDYLLTVEVTMASGQRQYETEGEPVSRHLGKLKRETGKPAYCLFVAPSINEACVAHFYGLQRLNISYYGGKSAIVPLPLDVFRKMVEDSRKASYTPDPAHVRRFLDLAVRLADESDSETVWYERVKEAAMGWLG